MLKNEKITRAIALVRKTIAPVVDELERLRPGHPFGLAKLQHMQELAEEVLTTEGFNIPELEILYFVVAVHDVGRHQEALLALDTLRNGPRHGVLSEEIVRRSGALDLLPGEYREAALQAVAHHSDLQVPDSVQGLARRLCYVLRDHDKAEVLLSESMLTDGVSKQLALHYQYSSHVEVLFNAPSDAVLDKFANAQTVSVTEIRSSYADYMLLQLAMMFEIENKGIYQRIIGSQGFQRRVAFVWSRLKDENQRSQFARGLTLLKTLTD